MKLTKSLETLLIAIGSGQPSRHSNATISTAIKNGWIVWQDEPGRKTGYVLTEEGKAQLRTK